MSHNVKFSTLLYTNFSFCVTSILHVWTCVIPLWKAVIKSFISFSTLTSSGQFMGTLWPQNWKKCLLFVCSCVIYDVNWGLSNISDLWEQKSKHITANLKRFKTFPKIPRKDFHIDPKDTKYSIHWTTDTANTIITRWLGDLNIPIMRQSRPSQV